MDVKWYLVVVLTCISLTSNDVERLFVCLFDHLSIFLGEMSVQVFFPFLNWVFGGFVHVDLGVCSVFWLLTPFQIYDLQIFFSYSVHSFHSLNRVVCCIEVEFDT